MPVFLGFGLELKYYMHIFGESVTVGRSEVLISSVIANKVAFQFVLAVTCLLTL